MEDNFVTGSYHKKLNNYSSLLKSIDIPNTSDINTNDLSVEV